ncbi:copper radical oxidase-like protein [Hymenopellis radicata]|nr:copper radical oxidase-like protein [Hymenopellis radicata]
MTVFTVKQDASQRGKCYLPDIPNGVRITSPFSAGATLLPLTPENDYTPEVLICGGSTFSDNGDTSAVDSQFPASDQCSRLVLTPAGIAAGWKVETMPQTRIMLELILLPDGRVVIVNGAQTGMAGYGHGFNNIGASDADHPALTPVVYDPAAPSGQRFASDGIPASVIPRMYHSTATLIPDGTIMLAGSNPNTDVSTVGVVKVVGWSHEDANSDGGVSLLAVSV